MPDEILDQRARRNYEAQARKLKDEIQDLRDRGDLKKADEKICELEFIEDELNAARGRGGKPRKERDDPEKSRIRVTLAIRFAIKKIAERGPKTAAHLTGDIETGTSMMYRDPATRWKA